MIEIMVVVVIVAILAVIALPTYLDYVKVLMPLKLEQLCRISIMHPKWSSNQRRLALRD